MKVQEAGIAKIVGNGILIRYQSYDKKINIPYGVKKIGSFAFSEC